MIMVGHCHLLKLTHAEMKGPSIFAALMGGADSESEEPPR